MISAYILTSDKGRERLASALKFVPLLTEVIGIDRWHIHINKVVTELDPAFFNQPDKSWDYLQWPGATGCYESHWDAWWNAINTGATSSQVLFLEDDFTLNPSTFPDRYRNGMESAPDWDAIMLGNVTVDPEMVTADLCRINQSTVRLHAYLVRRHLLREMVEAAETPVWPIDNQVVRGCFVKHKVFCFHPAIIGWDSSFPSNIRNEP